MIRPTLLALALAAAPAVVAAQQPAKPAQTPAAATRTPAQHPDSTKAKARRTHRAAATKAKVRPKAKTPRDSTRP